MKTDDMTKRADIAASTEGGSYASLFNPVSQLMGGTDRYPKWMLELTGDPHTAWLLSKVGATALLSAGLVGGARILSDQLEDAAEPQGPAGGTASRLNRTFDEPLEKAGAYGDVDRPGELNLSNITDFALPAGASVLAASLAWRGADDMMDGLRQARLERSVSRGKANFSELLKIRAQQARGTITPDQAAKRVAALGLDKGASLDKEADGLVSRTARGAFTLGGAFVLAMGLLSAGASYRYFSESEPGNVRYRAMRKGLEAYSSSRAATAPVQVVPTDARRMFDEIDGKGTEEPATARRQPELGERNRPIAVTV